MDIKLYSRREIEQKLSISRSTVDRWIAEPFKYNGMWFPKPDFKKGKIHRWYHTTINEWLVAISKRPLHWKGLIHIQSINLNVPFIQGN